MLSGRQAWRVVGALTWRGRQFFAQWWFRRQRAPWPQAGSRVSRNTPASSCFN